MVKISGVVIKGKEIGRKLGFPTANIEVSASLDLNPGVYAGKTSVSGHKYKSAIFVPRGGKVIESHIIGFSDDLYGQEIEIEIQEKIREIRKFNNEEELTNQIEKDIDIVAKK